VYRHYTQLLAVCPPQIAKANTRYSLANIQTNKRHRSLSETAAAAIIRDLFTILNAE